MIILDVAMVADICSNCKLVQVVMGAIGWLRVEGIMDEKCYLCS